MILGKWNVQAYAAFTPSMPGMFGVEIRRGLLGHCSFRVSGWPGAVANGTWTVAGRDRVALTGQWNTGLPYKGDIRFRTVEPKLLEGISRSGVALTWTRR